MMSASRRATAASTCRPRAPGVAPPRRQLRTPSSSARTMKTMPSSPGSRPGTVYGLMFWLSRRSIRIEPTRTTTPNASQPAAARRSVTASERACSGVSSAGSNSSSSDAAIARRSGLGDADGVGRHLRLAAFEEHPRVRLHGGEDRLLRRFLGRRREQRAAARRVLAQRLVLGDVLAPDAVERLHDLVGYAL